MADTLLARDIMQGSVITARETDSAADLCDLFQQEHVHGAPVVDEDDNLVGMVSTEDILIGSMSWPTEPRQNANADDRFPLVRDIMTAPAICAVEETQALDLCKMMWRFRIHHIPIIRDGKVTGMVSSLDVCRAIANGLISV